jgi:hypothetical protein
MKKILIVLILFAFMFFGCQKLGLSVGFQKEDSEVYGKAGSIDPSVVPITRAVIMKDNVLDLRNIGNREITLLFDDFRIRAIPEVDKDKVFYRFLVFEPKKVHNDFTVEFELDSDGSPLNQVIVQKENGFIVWMDGFDYKK